ncbi:unnamed protein product [Echinostoma caproni]|uniref:Peptidase A2 domain-containing protein n=1 Tax=Echinostoma caproni TaxID=27848 RepID=A0A183A8I3_9TREM|nr:unnamed protein product [Echinostoma caproni]
MKKESSSEPEVPAADRVNGVQLPAKRKGIFAKMLVNGEEVTFQLDSGASVNIIPRNFMPDTKLDPTQTRLVMWNGANGNHLLKPYKEMDISEEPLLEKVQTISKFLHLEQLPTAAKPLHQFGIPGETFKKLMKNNKSPLMSYPGEDKS